MEVIVRDNYMETHAKLNKTDYIKSPESIEEVTTSVWSHQWEGAPTKSWVIVMASTVAAAGVLIITVTYASHHSKKKKSTLSINIDNMVD